jgi:Domain of unknown function (DUF4185)/TIR domain
MAHDVFISYASGDKPVADAACATLESHGIRCWIAPRDVLAGMHYGEAIIDAIHDCRIMVLVFSSKANLSGHIPKEIERAVSQGTTVMPLRIENVSPAKSLDYFIGGVHWLDALTPPLEVHLQRLAANVQTLLSRMDSGKETLAAARGQHAPAPVGAVSARVAPRSARPTWEYAAIAGLAAVALVLGILTFRGRSHGNAAVASGVASAPTSMPAPPPAPTKPKKILAPMNAAPSAGTSVPAFTPPLATESSPAPTAHPANPHPEAAIHFIAESTTKLEQLIGDEDKETKRPTLSQTFTRFGIEGTSLGSSFDHQGRIYFLFGATLGRLPRFVHTMATTDAAIPEAGVRLDFLTNGGGYVAVQPTGVTMTPMDAPVAGISLNGQMYVAVSTNIKAGRATDRSILTKFSAPATFQTIRTISQLPDGRFIRMSIHAQPGPVTGLPPGGPFIFIWGTGKYRESDAYLSIVPAGEFESGKGTRYFSGFDAAKSPTWSDNELDATPIVKDGTLGDLSVTWCKYLGLWLMTYDRRTMPDNGIAFSYSRTPWGPWSEPEIVFNAQRDRGFGKFIHNPHRKTDDGLAGPVLRPRKEDAADLIGYAYAPYVVERWTKVQGSELNLYYLMSTGNPYVVVLMKSRLRVEQAP